ncbi:response regulator [Methylogaea oryzae]|uniref:response regulator n=1 Tax=Methylogaea oryzae TaxID=1295382 RepID=UPI001C3F4BCB|nr:response regulator transcription factor [Methylogaea oryzae]
MTIKIVLADDHRMFREAIRASLLAEGDFAILAEAGSGRETFAALQQAAADILVLDIALPDMSGIDVAQQVSRQYPRIGIVALSGYSDKLFIQEMFKAGAKGYVLKSAATTELLLSIRAVHQATASCATS